MNVESIILEEGIEAARTRWLEWRDQIHISFESDHDDFEPNRNDAALLRDRHHGAYNEDEGTGYCTRNEAHVMEKAPEIRKKDWSLK